MEAKPKTEIKYFVFYKPYNVLNQFTKEAPEHITLADFLKVEKDVYPLGRLDKDSEGLLILTNDKSLNSLLLSPLHRHMRSYFVQVDNDITEEAILKISKGVEIKLETGDYKTKSCTVKKLKKPPLLPERNPPIRVRQQIPTSWALIELTEGKNRQVRKMFAAVGFPVLRLVRVQIEDLKLGKLEPGKYYEISKTELFKLLKIEATAITKKETDQKKGFKSRDKTKTGIKAHMSVDKNTLQSTVKSNHKATATNDKKSTDKKESGDSKHGIRDRTTYKKKEFKPALAKKFTQNSKRK